MVATHSYLGALSRHHPQLFNSLGMKYQVTEFLTRSWVWRDWDGSGPLFSTCAFCPWLTWPRAWICFCSLSIFCYSHWYQCSSAEPKVHSLWCCSSGFPFLLQPFTTGYVREYGWLIAQKLHWRNVVEPDVKWTSLSEAYTSKSHGIYWREMAFQMNSGFMTLCDPSQMAVQIRLQNWPVSSLIFTEHFWRRKSPLGSSLIPGSRTGHVFL